MNSFGQELKMYAENGLKSATHWLTNGRQVTSDSKPRATVTSRGEVIELFTKAQTGPRPRTRDRE